MIPGGPSTATVSGVLRRAHTADEKADAAGLMFAEAVVTGIGDLGQLMVEFKRARADAQYAWDVYADALDQLARASTHQTSTGEGLPVGPSIQGGGVTSPVVDLVGGRR